MEKIHGMATIKRNGNNIIVDVGAELTIGGIKNNVQPIGRKAFFSQEFTLGEVEMKIPFTENVDLIKEQAMADVEIQFHSDNGSIYVIPSAAQTLALKPDGEGLLPLHYMGDAAVKA